MSAILAVLANTVGNSAPPPIPSFDGVSNEWSLWDWQGIDNTALTYTNDDTDQFSPSFSVAAPNPLEWSGLVPPTPYLIDQWNGYGSQADNISATTIARPELDSTNQRIVFNGTTTGLVGSTSSSPRNSVGTYYFDITPTSVGGGVIFEVGDGTDDDSTVTLILDAGTLYFSCFDSSNNPNTKQVDVNVNERIWICCGFDTAQVTPADQTFLLINNSATGVTSSGSGDINGISQMGFGVPNIGARNGATSDFFTGYIWTAFIKSQVDDSTMQTQYYNYAQYLKSLAP